MCPKKTKKASINLLFLQEEQYLRDEVEEQLKAKFISDPKLKVARQQKAIQSLKVLGLICSLLE